MPKKKSTLSANKFKISDEFNIILQKEYLILKPTDPRPILATESVRGCYAVMIYHKDRSAILHWDDDSCHSQIDKLMSEFLGDDLELSKNITVSIVGGWKDYPGSVKSGKFLTEHFRKMDVTLNVAGFQTKKSTGVTTSKTGFSLVSLDSRTGKVSFSDDWSIKFGPGDDRFRGTNATYRSSNLQRFMLFHSQIDDHKESGAPIYARDKFFDIQELQANNMCVAARNGSKADLIKYIDQTITDVNISPKNAKGWTPLHFACKQGHIEIAALLIDHGADLLKPNEAGKSPYDLLPESFNKRALLVQFRIVQSNIKVKPTILLDFALFSRHPEMFTPMQAIPILNIKDKLKNEAGLCQLEKSLGNVEKPEYKVRMSFG